MIVQQEEEEVHLWVPTNLQANNLTDHDNDLCKHSIDGMGEAAEYRCVPTLMVINLPHDMPLTLWDLHRTVEI